LIQLLLPIVFTVLCVGYEGLKVKSEVTRSVLRRNFRYQLATLYVTVLCGALSAHEQVKKVAQKPEEIFEILKDEVPQVATYLTMYVMTRVGIGLPLLLLSPAMNLWRYGDVMRNGPPPMACDFASEASNLGLILVLGLTYSVIAPGLSLVCVIFFAMAYLVYCWLFLYVYTPHFDCAGVCWYELFDGAMMGLVLGTLSLAALASAFEGFDSPEFVALLVLAGMVLIAYSMLCRRYGKPSRFLSFADACKLDRKAEKKPQIIAGLQVDYYVDPIIKQADGASDWRVARELAKASWRQSWGAWLRGRVWSDLEEHHTTVGAAAARGEPREEAAAAEVIEQTDQGQPQAAVVETMDEANGGRPEEGKCEGACCNNTCSGGSSSIGSSSSTRKADNGARGGSRLWPPQLCSLSPTTWGTGRDEGPLCRCGLVVIGRQARHGDCLCCR